jgi:dipeptidase D
LRDRYCRAYEKRYGKPPIVMVIHAGLECGVFTYYLPDLDIVSCGSIVVDLHSPDERLNKESIDRFFEVFADVIREK